MPTTDPQPTGRTFVVTVWQELDPAMEMAERWRFRLEEPHSHHTRIFAHPQGLIVALKEGALDSEPGEIEQQRI
jgi:hypothetical protein